MEEIKYPIYTFNLKWSQEGKQDEKYSNRHTDLPPGRIWNGTSFNKMFKEEKSQEWLDSYIKDYWEKYIENQIKLGKVKNPELVKIEAKFKERESWYLTWFQHETFDIGQTDKEVLESFERFVTRKEILNEVSQVKEGKDAYCLMGAEDRWRWHGAEPNGEQSDHSPPPCRCSGCKKHGVIRINH